MLSVTFAQNQSESGEVSLKNSLQVSFKGISFTADDVTPAVLSLDDGTSLPVSLLSYSEPTPLSIAFDFTGDVSLIFAVSDTDSEAALSLSAKLPENAVGITLNYKPASGFSVTEKTNTRLILNSKNLTYAFTSAKIDEREIFLSSKNSVSYYVAYNPSVEFSFANLDSDMPIMQKSAYDSNIAVLRNDLVSAVNESIKTNQTLSEKAVIAYVSELASRGRYTEAVNSIPDSFKKGNKRTYLSATYFDSLESMYPTLEMHNQNMAEMLKNALSSGSLSIFGVEDFADYLSILPERADIRKILSLPQKFLEQMTLSEACGVLSTYVRLASLHSSLADLLSESATECLSIIEKYCVLSDSSLKIVEKDLPVSNSLALTTGNALIHWGEFNGAEEYTLSGYAIINSVLQEDSLDLLTLSEMYPVLVENPYYPHYKLLSKNQSGVIWAWTCAPSISYSESGNSATLSLNFPKNEVNYAIVSGIRPFSDIEIYGLSFHADARFESYNSSGFIYREAKRALFLKSRHKTETEVVRLSFSPVRAAPSPAPAQPTAQKPEPAPAPAQPTAQKPEPTPAAENSSNSIPTERPVSGAAPASGTEAEE